MDIRIGLGVTRTGTAWHEAEQCFEFFDEMFAFRMELSTA